MYYLRERYYRPTTGRFVSEDPIRSGLNYYTYCVNNPIKFIDPSGKQRESGYYTINDKYAWYSDPDATEFGKYSDTYKIIDSLGKQWQVATTLEQRDRLHSLANDARNMFRSGTPYVYAQDKITRILLQNADTARSVSQLYSDWESSIYKNQSTTQLAKAFWFATMVGPNGDWDLKEKVQWQVPYNTFNGQSMADTTWQRKVTPFMYFNGMIISGADLGNINYGVTGIYAGFSEDTLLDMAGLVNVVQGVARQEWVVIDWAFTETRGDDPRDYLFTMYGMHISNRY